MCSNQLFHIFHFVYLLLTNSFSVIGKSSIILLERAYIDNNIVFFIIKIYIPVLLIVLSINFARLFCYNVFFLSSYNI